MNAMRRVKIAGTGMSVPPRVVTNQDLEKLMDTSDEWIQQRSGIKERRHVDPGTAPSDMAADAARKACAAAGIAVTDLDLVIVATLSPEHMFPGTSVFVQEKLGLGTTPSMDVRCQCTGFLYALNVGQLFVASGQYERVLVVGVEAHSPGLDFSTAGRDVAVLFGDGAGAVVLSKSEDPERGLIDFELHSEGQHASKLWIEFPSMAHTPYLSREVVEEGRHFPKMDGRFVFRHAVTRMPEVLNSVLAKNKLKPADVDLFLFHQANLRINEFVAQQMGIPMEKTFNNIEKYGNCSAASIPLLIDECVRSGRIKSGSLVCMTAFGSGFTWGSALMRW